MGLWDRDVCEIFIAPDEHVIERYFEFEAAPTGEWLDVAIHWSPTKAGIRLGISLRNELRRDEERSPKAVPVKISSLVWIGMRIPGTIGFIEPQTGRTLARKFISLRRQGSKPRLPRMATDQDAAAGFPLTEGLRLAFV